MIREVRWEGQGAAHGECGCSSLRVRWWWMLTIKSHGVQISIAGYVEEMVRRPKSYAPRVALYRGSSLDPNPA